jgi:omega-6 fatty acid desaturase (delta-12 desaturase)
MDDLTKLLKEIKITEEKTKEKTKEKINETKLFQKYKSTYSAAFADLGQHALFLWGVFYALYLYKDSYVTIFTLPLLNFLLTRTFIIFHDCQHDSYTPSPIVNHVISHIAGVFVLTSPNWIIDHHTHHLVNGNIENEYHYFFNETVTLTKNQYLSLSDKMKQFYFYLKKPYIFFTIVPQLYYFIYQKVVYVLKKVMRPHKFQQSMNYILYNNGINIWGTYLLFYYLYNLGILTHYLVSFFMFSSLSVITFHNQHTYNPAYVVGNDEWTQKNSGILGSSFIQIPWFLKYFYMGIEYHHIHHMNSKIPGYNMQEYHEQVVKQSNLFDSVTKLSLWDCYQNIGLVLYDEDTKRYIRMDEIKKE